MVDDDGDDDGGKLIVVISIDNYITYFYARSAMI